MHALPLPLDPFLIYNCGTFDSEPVVLFREGFLPFRVGAARAGRRGRLLSIAAVAIGPEAHVDDRISVADMETVAVQNLVKSSQPTVPTAFSA